MIEPNILAFQNADVLTAIHDAPTPWTKAGLAAHLGRDKSNLGKTLARMAEEGLLSADPLGLTEAGRAQLAAFNRARHGGERRKAQGRWRADALRRNPLNRRPDMNHAADIAQTIQDVGDVLVPIVVSAPDAHGVRTIWAGEHRWEAVKLLLAEDECPAVLAEDGLLFTEREATPGEAAVIALIENSTRRDLNPWQDAQQLRAAADDLNLSAAELARRIGRAREGSRGGVRDVQVKLKVAREATLAAVRAYEADPSAPGAWEILRDSVSEKRPEDEIVTTKAQRLALAELFARADQVVGAEVRILPSGHSAEGARLAQYGLAVLIRDAGGDRAKVTQAGADYLKAEDLSYPWQLVAYAREKLGFPGRWGGDKAQTEWLNVLPTSAATAPAPQPDPEVAAALRGIEPIGDVEAADPAILDVERWTLPNTRPGWKGGPIAEIEIGRIADQGWIVATHAQFPNGGWGAPFADCPANARRYVSRTEALCAAIDIIRKGLSTHHVGQMLSAQVEKWLIALDPERGPATAADTTDPWLTEGWTPIAIDFLAKAGTVVGPTLIAPNKALIAEAREAPLLTLYSRSEERYAGTGQAERYERVTLYRARVTLTLPDGSELESSRIPGATERMAAIQLATEDLLHEAGKHQAVLAVRPAIEWLDAMSGQFVVGGKNCLNASRAQDRRFALGWDKRQSNSGGGRASDEGDRVNAEAAGRMLLAERPETATPHPIVTAGDQTHPTNAALKLLAEERFRQVSAEGHTPEQDDDMNGDGELSQAAAAYAAASSGDPDAALFWPGGWDPYAFKPTGTVRDLVKAGALILAEIERRQRAGEAALGLVGSGGPEGPTTEAQA